MSSTMTTVFASVVVAALGGGALWYLRSSRPQQRLMDRWFTNHPTVARTDSTRRRVRATFASRTNGVLLGSVMALLIMVVTWFVELYTDASHTARLAYLIPFLGLVVGSARSELVTAVRERGRIRIADTRAARYHLGVPVWALIMSAAGWLCVLVSMVWATTLFVRFTPTPDSLAAASGTLLLGLAVPVAIARLWPSVLRSPVVASDEAELAVGQLLRRESMEMMLTTVAALSMVLLYASPVDVSDLPWRVRTDVAAPLAVLSFVGVVLCAAGPTYFSYVTHRGRQAHRWAAELRQRVDEPL